jgi:hypothetical protein
MEIRQTVATEIFRAYDPPMSEQPPETKMPWYERDGNHTILLILSIVALMYAKKLLGENWWAWFALVVAAILTLWLLWRLLRPLALFVQQEGIVGCWRWLRDKIFLPVMHGRRGK